jgi:amino acid adenylation domain-containing protein
MSHQPRRAPISRDESSTTDQVDILSNETGRHEFQVDESLCNRLQQFCSSEGIEDEAVLLAALCAAQHRRTAAPNLHVRVLGAMPGSQHTPRDMVNTRDGIRTVRTTIDAEMSLADLVKQARKALSSPLIDDGLAPDTVDISFVMYQPRGRLNGETTSAGRRHTMNSPGSVQEAGIQFHTWRAEEGGLFGQVRFSKDTFDNEDAACLISTYCDILCSGLDDPTTPVSHLPLVSGLERVTQTLHLSGRERWPSVYDAFREQVATHPHRIAVSDAAQQLTYSQLDHQAGLVSVWLAHRHYTAEAAISVLARRSVEAIVLYLGILRANHAYVPLDIKSPAERLSSMLEDVGGPRLVLYSADMEPLASQLTNAVCVPVALVMREAAGLEPVEYTMPSPSSLAAIIFTSGTTGRPKGVMIEHGSIVRVAKEKGYQIPVDTSEPAPVVAHLLNPAFDAAIMEIYTALLNGSKLCCVDEATLLDPCALSATFRHEQVAFAVLTPAFLSHLLHAVPEMFKSLRMLVVGGDRFKSSDARQAVKYVRGTVFNGYGPTENTVVSTLYRIPSDPRDIPADIPIGQAVEGSIACIVDAQQRLVPPGVVGELVVAGDGLARGYLNSTLDASRFVPVEINGLTVRAYRTGDLARLHPRDMQLQFLGRRDQQVKIRGHRVEVAEIDRALLGHPAVCEVATILHQSNGAPEAELISFVTTSPSESQVSNADLRDRLETHAREKLPPYMAPKAVIVIERLPLTNNGKVNSRSLAQIAESAFAVEVTSAAVSKRPWSAKEEQLRVLWALVLGVPASSLTLQDHFVKRGGDSFKVSMSPGWYFGGK